MRDRRGLYSNVAAVACGLAVSNAVRGRPTLAGFFALIGVSALLLFLEEILKR